MTEFDITELRVECEMLSDIISVNEVIAINELITDPDSFEQPDEWQEGERITEAEIGGPEFEVNRKEDYHNTRQLGIIETLIETQLPMECKQDSSVLRLTSVIMTEIAQNQAFSEGNKRTAYITGTLFLIKCQLIEQEKAIYPLLDKELTDKLSDLAIDKTEQEDTLNRDQFFDYLKDRLEKES